MVRSSSTFNDYFSYETKRVRSEGKFLELTDSYIYAPDRAAMATYNTLFDKKENIRKKKRGIQQTVNIIIPYKIKFGSCGL